MPYDMSVSIRCCRISLAPGMSSNSLPRYGKKADEDE